MRTTFRLGVFAFAVKCTVFGQLYLLTGSPTPQDSRSFSTWLMEVTERGRLKGAVDLASGSEWIGVFQDIGVGIIVPNRSEAPVSVVDLKTAAVAKSCVVPGPLRINNWLVDIPGEGRMLEWDVVGSPSLVKGMSLDPSVACAKSFSTVPPGDIRFVQVGGKAGVASLETDDGLPGVIGRDGELVTSTARTVVKFEIDRLPAAMGQGAAGATIVINNSKATVVHTIQGLPSNWRFLMFRKGDRTWHVMPVPGDASNLRGFGKFVTIVEARTKQAVVDQMKKGANIEINNDVRERELSSGALGWREIDSPMGPDMEVSFAEAMAVFPGRLHLYNIDSGQLFSLETKQGDSEALLVEDDTFYYRVSDQLYSAQITRTGFGVPKLLATDEAIRDAHWAFIKH